MSDYATSKTQTIVLVVLTLGGFSMGIAEFISMWMAPTIAIDLQTSQYNITTAASYYALGVMAGIPILSPLIKYISHQKMLTLLLFWCFAGNITTSFITSWEQLHWVRFLSGMPHGMYFGIASMVLMQLLPKNRHGFGIGTLMSGIGLALLLVVPTSFYLGDYQNWRVIARVVGLLDLIIILCLHDLLNDAPPPPDSRNNISLLQAVNNPLLWWILIISIGIFCGRMAIFAHAESIIHQVSFLSKQHTPLVIMASGIGTYFGFVLGGILADKNLYLTILGSLLYSIIASSAFYWMAPYPIWLYVGFVLLGSCTVVLPALQLLVIHCAPKAPTLASCLNHGALNIGNAIGPLMGTAMIASGFGVMSITWIGSVTGIIVLAIFCLGQNKAKALQELDHSKI